MVTCAVKLCSSNSNKLSKTLSDIGFHRFPKDPKKIAQWEAAINRPNWKANLYSRICSKHFKEQLFYISSDGARKLCENAVPTEFLPLLPVDNILLQSTSLFKDRGIQFDITDTPGKINLKRKLIQVTDIAERRRKRIKILEQTKRRLLKKIKILKNILNDLDKNR